MLKLPWIKPNKTKNQKKQKNQKNKKKHNIFQTSLIMAISK